ncbi:hypothetical protein T08_6288 [Trichinella sp. T8]|nr:hypothetical protein T08_6288 [Trichinella sp. T8]
MNHRQELTQPKKNDDENGWMNCLKGREKSTVNNNLVDSLKRIRPNLFIRRLEGESFV